MLEIHEVREGVEAQAARLCAERASPSVLRELKELLKRQVVVVERGDDLGWSRPMPSSTAWSQKVRATGNSEVILLLEGQMRLGLRQVSSNRNQRRRGLTEHQAILASINDRQLDTAEQLMREHIRHTRETLATQFA